MQATTLHLYMWLIMEFTAALCGISNCKLNMTVMLIIIYKAAADMMREEEIISPTLRGLLQRRDRN